MAISQAQQQAQLTEAQALDAAIRDSIEETISILQGIGPLCSDIDELIAMLELSLKNDSQLNLVRSHMAPKRMRR